MRVTGLERLLRWLTNQFFLQRIVSKLYCAWLHAYWMKIPSLRCLQFALVTCIICKNQSKKCISCPILYKVTQYNKTFYIQSYSQTTIYGVKIIFSCITLPMSWFYRVGETQDMLEFHVYHKVQKNEWFLSHWALYIILLETDKENE